MHRRRSNTGRKKLDTSSAILRNHTGDSELTLSAISHSNFGVSKHFSATFLSESPRHGVAWQKLKVARSSGG